MKSKLLKLANVKSEQEFYKKYPTEDAFLKAFPKMKSELKQFANGGPGDGDEKPKRKTKYPVLDVSKITGTKSTADSALTWIQLPLAQADLQNRINNGDFNLLSKKNRENLANEIYKSYGVNPDLLYRPSSSITPVKDNLNINTDISDSRRQAYAPKSWDPDALSLESRYQKVQDSKGKKVNSPFAIINVGDAFGDKTKEYTLPGRDSNKIIIPLKEKIKKDQPLSLTPRNLAAENRLTTDNPDYTGYNVVKSFLPQNAKGGVWNDIGAGAYGVGEGMLDTVTFGLTDQLTDKGYDMLQKAGGTTDQSEIEKQNAIRGGANIAGAAGTAILTGGATTGAAIGQGAKGANEIVQNTNIVPDEYKQTVGSAINFAGTVGSMAAGSPSSLSNPAATQFMNSNFTQGVQQMNQYKPYMNAVGFRNGGIQQYVDGGMGPNAEVEKQENTVAPDGTFTQYNGPSHEDGGIETTLDQGEMIFSDKLKPIGSKKTYAQLNKSFNTQKEDELLNDPKTNAVQKLTAAMMRRAKLTQSIALFQNQEQQKEAKVQAYADKMGVPISTPNSQAEEQMANESQEMGEEMPMARMGGMIKRADGSYSKRGLWDNIRANKGSGKKPTKAMLEQEKKIKAKYPDGGAFPPGGIPKSADIPKVYYSASEIALDPLKRQNAINNMGIRNLAVNNIGSTMPYDFGTPQYVMTDQESPLILRKMRDALKAQQYANGGKMPTEILRSRLESHMSPQEVDSYLEQYAAGGSFDNPGFKALPEAVQQKIMANYEMGGMLEDTEMDYTPMEGEEYMEYKKGGIYIKPENRGKFSAAAKRAGMGTQAYAKHILANKDNYSSTLVKRANFARNAAKWHHEMGGLQQFAEAGMYGDPLKPAWQTSSTPTAVSAGIANQGNTFIAPSPSKSAVGQNKTFSNFLNLSRRHSYNQNQNVPMGQYIETKGNAPELVSGKTMFNFGPKLTDKGNYRRRPEVEGEPFDWQNAAGIAGVGLLSNAGNIYNIARGLQKPDTNWQYQRATAQYLDPNADLAENARMYNEAKRAAQYASAGNATNYLANTAAGRAAKMNADRTVRTNYGNINSQIANQLSQFNTQIANQELNAKQMDEAQRRNLIGQGLSGVGENTLGFVSDLMRMNAYQNYYNNPDFNKMTKGLPSAGSRTTSRTIGKTAGK